MLMIRRKDALLSIISIKSHVEGLEKALNLYKQFNASPQEVADAICQTTLEDEGSVDLRESFKHIALGLKGDLTASVAKQKGIDKLKYLINSFLDKIAEFIPVKTVIETQVRITKDNFNNVDENLSIANLQDRIKTILATDNNKQYFFKRLESYLAGEIETTSVDKLETLKTKLDATTLLTKLIAVVAQDLTHAKEALNDEGHTLDDFLLEYKNKVHMVSEEYKDKELLGEDKLIQSPSEEEITNVPMIETVINDQTQVNATPSSEVIAQLTIQLIALLEETFNLALKEVNGLINKFNFNLPDDKVNVKAVAGVLNDILDQIGKDMITQEEFILKSNNIVVTFKNLITLDEHLTDVCVHKLNVINSLLTTYQQAYDLTVEMTNLGYVVTK